MLTISDAIFAHYSNDARNSLPRELSVKLRAQHGEKVARWDDAMLHAYTERTLCAAREFGMEWRSSFYAFLVLSVRMHPYFYQHPKVVAALRDDPFDTPDDRLKRLGTTVADSDWQEISDAAR